MTELSRKPWKVKRCGVKVDCKLGVQCDTTREVVAILSIIQVTGDRAEKGSFLPMLVNLLAQDQQK